MKIPIIEVRHISKRYIIGEHKRYNRLTESIMNTISHPIKRIKEITAKKPIIWALKNVSFNINEGEVLGIIGRNGSGKTTLLKILSQITYPTSGKIILRGRVGSLLEVGTGFHPELSGRENIYLNGAILGMKKREIEQKFDEIVKFAEIEKFLDTPVKRYSSGMYVRLAFAVAAHLDPEILLIDEVLAVGDAQFQKKCLGKMKEVSQGGRTVLFVSHNMNAISVLCKTAIVLENGKIKHSGNIEESINQYLDVGESQQNNIEINLTEFKNTFSDTIKFFRYYIEDINGKIGANQLVNSKEYNIIIETEIIKNDPNLAFFISFYTEDNNLLFISDIHDSGVENTKKLTVGKKKFIIPIPKNFLSNRIYFIEFSCVIHHKGWPVLTNNNQRLKIIYFRDNNLNDMGYDEMNHPFNGSSKPGLINPLINWKIENIN